MAQMKFRDPQPADINSTSELYEMVTPADTDLQFLTRKIRVGAAGTLVLLDNFGNTITIAALAGEQFTVAARQVKAATTGGMNILVMY